MWQLSDSFHKVTPWILSPLNIDFSEVVCIWLTFYIIYSPPYNPYTMYSKYAPHGLTREREEPGIRGDVRIVFHFSNLLAGSVQGPRQSPGIGPTYLQPSYERGRCYLHKCVLCILGWSHFGFGRVSIFERGFTEKLFLVHHYSIYLIICLCNSTGIFLWDNLWI